MRVPLRQKAKLARGQSASTQSVPAPVGGWNARDALADMAPTDAITLENWFPRTSHVEVRNGCSSYATGMTGTGKTLASYYAPNGTGSMFCFTGSGVYDVTSSGAVGASLASRSSAIHEWVNFGDGTNNYLIALNGVDDPLYYDGSTWLEVTGITSPALTGTTITNLIGVSVFKGRLIFIEKESLSFWYLAAGAAGGALTEFPLDAECPKGGYLVATATWTIDAGNGLEDKAVFITSQGEVVVYEGTNPSSAASWAKVGTYQLGKPLGRRCVCQYGGDLIIITENGAFPLSAALQSAKIDYKLALSFKVENAFTEAARTYGSVFGWKPIIFPGQSALIVNVPKVEDGEHQQYVMNTITKAWCKFTGWNAEDFIVFGGLLYYVNGTTVYKAWTGYVDDASAVVAYAKTAFNNFGRSGLQKLFVLFRPVLSVNGALAYLTDIDVDFGDNDIAGTASYTPSTAGIWGTALWGSGLWGYGANVVQFWTAPNEYPGTWAAGKLKISNNALTIKWMSVDYVYQYGNVVG